MGAAESDVGQFAVDPGNAADEPPAKDGLAVQEQHCLSALRRARALQNSPVQHRQGHKDGDENGTLLSFGEFITAGQIAAGRALSIPLLVTEQNPTRLGRTAMELDVSGARLVDSKMKFSMLTPAVDEYFKSHHAIRSIVLFGIEVQSCPGLTINTVGPRVHLPDGRGFPPKELSGLPRRRWNRLAKPRRGPRRPRRMPGSTRAGSPHVATAPLWRRRDLERLNPVPAATER